MRTLIGVLIIILLMNCKEVDTSKNLANNDSSEFIMSVELDGQVHAFKAIDWQRSTVDYSDNKIYFQLAEEGNQVLFTLELHGIYAEENHSGNYTLPDANAANKTIYLSFLDKKRKTKALNRRIEFKEGNINIEHLSKEKLKLTFNGQGSGIMERDLRFNIKGYANVNLKNNKG